MRYLFYSLCILSLLSLPAKGSAFNAPDTSINPYIELTRILAHFNSSTIYTFNSYKTYDRSDSSSHHTYDTVHASYAVRGDNYQVATDSTEEVQNDLYNVKVYNKDSFIIVGNPVPFFPKLLEADIPGDFFQSFLANLKVVDSGLLRNILADFELSSPWYSYLIAYDSAMDFLAIKYSMRNHIPAIPTGSYTILAPAYDYTNLLASVYITIMSSPPSDIFSTDKYFTRSGNNFVPKAPYTGYTILNSMTNQ